MSQRAAEEAAAILRLAKDKGALQFGEFLLSAGKRSNYYFDGRLVTLDPQGAQLVTAALLPVMYESGAEAIAGPAVAAVPMVAAITLSSQEHGRPVPGLIVRAQAKGHGTGRLIEGPLINGSRVAVVDDTCSTGASLFHAINALEAKQCRIVKVMCILDRKQGGSDELRSRGYDFMALLEADEQGEVIPAATGGRR